MASVPVPVTESDVEDLDGIPPGFSPGGGAGQAAASSSGPIIGLTQEQFNALLQAATGRASRDDSNVSGKDIMKLLPKPEAFSAPTREQEHTLWPNWVWGFRQYMGALDINFTSEMDFVEKNLSAPLPMSMQTSAQQQRARQVYAMLASLIRGRGYLVVKQCETGNGYEALRQLMAMFAPKSQGRSLGILTAITQVPAFKQNEALLPQVLELERVFEEYESASSEAIQESVKTALLLRCLPNATKNQIFASLPENASYSEVREACLRMGRQHFKWQSVSYFHSVPQALPSQGEAVPMEIDVVSRYFKSAGKGKQGGKPKGTFKGPPKHPKGSGKQDGKQDKGKQQKGDKGSKGGGKGNQGGKQGKGPGNKANVQCHNCGRMGHYARDCWRPRGTASVNRFPIGRPTCHRCW